MSISNLATIQGTLVSEPERDRNGNSVSALVLFNNGRQVYTDGKWVADKSAVFITFYGQAANYLSQYGFKGTRIAVECYVRTVKTKNGFKTYFSAQNVDVLNQPAEYYDYQKQQILEAQTAQADFDPSQVPSQGVDDFVAMDY